MVVCSGRNRALIRVQEMVEHASDHMGRPTVVVTDSPECFEKYSARIVEVPKSDFDQSGALTNYAPGALLMGYITAMVGETYSRGCKDNWEFAAHGNGIKISQMVLD
jgi:glucosamine--fructose-6-phosphate aminotransferase (isomerizing)